MTWKISVKIVHFEWEITICKMEEEKRMEHVTIFEKYGMVLNAREMLLDVIDARFKTVPEDMALKVKNIESRETLKSLNRKAATCQNIEALWKMMNEAHGN